jgi:hypothetical protein
MPEKQSKCPPEAEPSGSYFQNSAALRMLPSVKINAIFIYMFSCDTGKASNFQSGLKLKSPDPVSTSMIRRWLNLWRNFMAFTAASVHMLKGLIFTCSQILP